MNGCQRKAEEGKKRLQKYRGCPCSLCGSYTKFPVRPSSRDFQGDNTDSARRTPSTPINCIHESGPVVARSWLQALEGSLSSLWSQISLPNPSQYYPEAYAKPNRDLSLLQYFLGRAGESSLSINVPWLSSKSSSADLGLQASHTLRLDRAQSRSNRVFRRSSRLFFPSSCRVLARTRHHDWSNTASSTSIAEGGVSSPLRLLQPWDDN